ncbi:MAG: hypothetical protein CMJ58_24430 [Planctomycetaceae bacterium]|nr:hypothetical protein [Planctomycetaceae bacterium]
MTINAHLDEFQGLPVVDFSCDSALPSDGSKAIRIALDWEAHDSGQSFLDLFAAFLDAPGSAEVLALLIGDWGGTGEGNDSGPVVEALVSARDRLPNLRHLFLGEMTMEESEISWITQSDVSPIFEAFPLLETFCIRGGNDLRLGKPRHKALRKLVIETGGMSGAIVREVASGEFPELVHLELWLGDDGYGNDVSEDDLRGLLSSGACSRLTYLGLRDDCNADATAKLLAETSVPPTLKTLDLSLGTLGDEGASALSGCPWLGQLKVLDMHFHYMSAEAVSQLKSVVPAVNADDVQQPDDWDGEPHRYVAVGE